MTKGFTVHRGKNAKKGRFSQFFDEEGQHLNDSGVTLYIEALLLDRVEDLPKSIRKHAEECPVCQHEIADFYDFMKEEGMEIASPHPFLDKKSFRTTFRKAMHISSSLGRVAAVVLLTVVSCLGYLIVNTPYQTIETAITSPFENKKINVDFTAWEMDAEKAKIFYLPNGSNIYIEASSFVDVEGNPVKGKIKIDYRELRKASDIIASGIPVQYDSAGVKYPFESDGMFEIRGKKEGEPVFIAPGKSIKVNMVSSNYSPNFNNYYLNEERKVLTLHSPLIHQVYAQNSTPKWQLLGKSILVSSDNFVQKKQQLLDRKQAEIDSLASLIETLETQPIQEEVLIEKTIPSNHSDDFQISLNTKENPELIQYRDQIWRYAGENKQESPTQKHHWILSEKWDQIALTPLKYKPLSLKGHTTTVNSAIFSTDGNRIVTASDDHTAKVWSNKAQYLFTLAGHKDAINFATFSPNNEYIVTASEDRTAKIWSKSGDLLNTLTGHTQGVQHVTFSSDGRYILTSSKDETARLWNYRGQIVKVFEHESEISPAQFSEDSKCILTINAASHAQIWNVKGDSLSSIEGNFSSVAFAQDSKKIITTSKNVFDGNAALWSIEGQKLKEFDLNDVSAKFSPDGQHIASVTGNGARLWYANSARSYNTVLIRNMKNLPGENRNGHEGLVSSLEFSNNGQGIITASRDKTAKIWGNDGKVLHTLRSHIAPIKMAVFSPDMQQILTASEDGTAKLWVERDIRDVYELALVKQPKEYEDKNGKPVQVAGKRFYTTIQQITPEKASEEIIRPNLKANPIYDLVNRYEKAIEDKSVLEQQIHVKTALLFRKFKVKKFGVYNCNRIYKPIREIVHKSYFDFEYNIQPKKVLLYHITGKNNTVIIPYEYSKNTLLSISFSKEYPNTFVMVLPKDKIAFFSAKELDNVSQNQSEEYHFHLTAITQIHSKEELDNLFQNIFS